VRGEKWWSSIDFDMALQQVSTAVLPVIMLRVQTSDKALLVIFKFLVSDLSTRCKLPRP